MMWYENTNVKDYSIAPLERIWLFFIQSKYEKSQEFTCAVLFNQFDVHT